MFLILANDYEDDKLTDGGILLAMIQLADDTARINVISQILSDNRL